jgi:hypothetical protein
MTTTLTREQIEAIQANKGLNYTPATVLALCALALQALDMQPRPIADAPRDGSLIYAWHKIHDCWIAIRFTEKYGWIEKTLTTIWPEESFTHFVSSSSLPKATT